MPELTPAEEQRRFRIPERDKLEAQHAPRIERALREQITAVVNENLTDEEIAQAPNRLDEYSAELEAVLLAFAFAMSDVGIEAAIEDLENVALAVNEADIDAENKDAIRRAIASSLLLINNTTRTALQNAIPAWLTQSARNVSDLLDELEPQMSLSRAQNIATTEGTKIFSQGVQTVGIAAGVTQLQWYTMKYERVCLICRKMNGKRRELSGTYDIMLPVTQPPPAHPRCRCGELMVIRSIEV